MKLNRTGSPLSGEERNKLNQNWDLIEKTVAKAETDSEDANQKATAADTLSKNTQNQVDQMTIEGDSSLEAAQARVDKNSKTYGTLKQRLDFEQEETDERITSIENEFDKSVGYGVRWNYVSDTYERIGKAAGLTQTDFDNVYPWSAMRRCIVDDAAEVIAYYGEPDFIEGGTLGQVMVEIPKHYIKRIVNHPYIEFWINGDYAAGFELQPTFKRGLDELDAIYVGAYNGSVYDVSASEYLFNDEQTANFTAGTGDKLSSISGAKPASGLTQDLTLPKSRIIANNRGTGWGLYDFDTHSALQTLLLIEYANFNSQAVIGNGVVSKASGTGNESEINGATSFLGNASGMAPGTNGQVPITYRGVENFWGNIYSWCDGLNISSHKPYFNTTGMDFESDKFNDNYQYVEFGIPEENGYPKMIGSTEAFHHGFIATELGGNSASYLADYFYQSTGNRVARVGGDWNNGSSAGAFFLYLNNSSASRDRTIGARLLCAKKSLKSS